MLVGTSACITSLLGLDFCLLSLSSRAYDHLMLSKVLRRGYFMFTFNSAQRISRWSWHWRREFAAVPLPTLSPCAELHARFVAGLRLTPYDIRQVTTYSPTATTLSQAQTIRSGDLLCTVTNDVDLTARLSAPTSEGVVGTKQQHLQPIQGSTLHVASRRESRVSDKKRTPWLALGIMTFLYVDPLSIL